MVTFNLMELENKIKNKEARVAIIGLGYVGLPHAVEIAKAGFFVLGVDIREEKVKNLNQGKSHINDVKDESLKEVIKSGKFKASSNFEILKDVDVIIICVPTPLDKNKVPDTSYIEDSCKEIKKRLHKDELVVLESTTYPGTTEEIILSILQESGLEVGKDFYLAFAPERIDPGNETPFSDIPKVVGGVTEKCTELTKLFYSQFLNKVYPVSSSKVAEMTKMLENTYRLVNISMINEFSLLCNKMNIDVWEVIEAAKTKPYGFTPFYPSGKVGGHCIPLDPFYLSYKARGYNFWARFIELAGQINEQMPHYVITRVNYILNKKAKKPISGSKILVWGVSYKKDVADLREGAALDIIPELLNKGAEVDYFDPYIKEMKLENRNLKSVDYLPGILRNYDLVLILTDHSGFDYDEVAQNSKLVVDTRNAIKSREYNNVSWW